MSDIQKFELIGISNVKIYEDFIKLVQKNANSNIKIIFLSDRKFVNIYAQQVYIQEDMENPFTFDYFIPIEKVQKVIFSNTQNFSLLCLKICVDEACKLFTKLQSVTEDVNAERRISKLKSISSALEPGKEMLISIKIQFKRKLENENLQELIKIFSGVIDVKGVRVKSIKDVKHLLDSRKEEIGPPPKAKTKAVVDENDQDISSTSTLTSTTITENEDQSNDDNDNNANDSDDSVVEIPICRDSNDDFGIKDVKPFILDVGRIKIGKHILSTAVEKLEQRAKLYIDGTTFGLIGRTNIVEDSKENLHYNFTFSLNTPNFERKLNYYPLKKSKLSLNLSSDDVKLLKTEFKKSFNYHSDVDFSGDNLGKLNILPSEEITSPQLKELKRRVNFLKIIRKDNEPDENLKVKIEKPDEDGTNDKVQEMDTVDDNNPNQKLYSDISDSDSNIQISSIIQTPGPEISDKSICSDSMISLTCRDIYIGTNSYSKNGSKMEHIKVQINEKNFSIIIEACKNRLDKSGVIFLTSLNGVREIKFFPCIKKVDKKDSNNYTTMQIYLKSKEYENLYKKLFLGKPDYNYDYLEFDFTSHQLTKDKSVKVKEYLRNIQANPSNLTKANKIDEKINSNLNLSNSQVDTNTCSTSTANSSCILSETTSSFILGENASSQKLNPLFNEDIILTCDSIHFGQYVYNFDNSVIISRRTDSKPQPQVNIYMKDFHNEKSVEIKIPKHVYYYLTEFRDQWLLFFIPHLSHEELKELDNPLVREMLESTSKFEGKSYMRLLFKLPIKSDSSEEKVKFLEKLRHLFNLNIHILSNLDLIALQSIRFVENNLVKSGVPF